MRALRYFAVFLLGAALGGAGIWSYCREAMIQVRTNAIADQTRQKLFDTIVGMTLVRESKTNKFLADGEEETNSSIYALSFMRDELPYERTNRVYSMIARYREMYPHNSGDSEIDKRVHEFLMK